MKYTSRRLITAPTVEPVTLAEVKAHLRITHSDEDDLLNAYIKSAREYTERYLSRSLVQQTWDIFYDVFPLTDEPLEIPLPPLQSVSSIKYFDSSNVEQTWDSASYTVDTDAVMPKVYPAIDQVYPSSRYYPKSVTVRVLTGYQDSGASPVDLADGVPETIKTAIKILVAHYNENREMAIVGVSVSDAPFSYKTTLAPHRVGNIG